ncbi:hypothetical protein LINPERPRIM_LOCUS18641 [Linum perenne]
MAPQPKRRKIKQPPKKESSSGSKNLKDEAAIRIGFKNPATAEIGLSSGNNVRADSMIRIQQSKNFAVSEAQKDGCTGNYKIFDSPFGNFLLPVVPTREDLLSG